MSQPITGELDVILKKLIDDPQQFDNVKRTLEGKMGAPSHALQAPQTHSCRRYDDDDDDMFDNMPV